MAYRLAARSCNDGDVITKYSVQSSELQTHHGGATGYMSMIGAGKLRSKGCCR